MKNFTFQTLGKNLLQANISAMNRAAASAITDVNRFIRTKYNIKAGEIAKRVKILTRASKTQGYVKVRIMHGAIPLYDFRATQIGEGGRPVKGTVGHRSKNTGKTKYMNRFKTGVMITETKGKRELIRSADKSRGAFITTMKSGHKGVFIRSGEENKKNTIKEMFGIDIASLIVPQSGNSAALIEIRTVFNKVYQDRLIHELKRKYSK